MGRSVKERLMEIAPRSAVIFPDIDIDWPIRLTLEASSPVAQAVFPAPRVVVGGLNLDLGREW